MLIDTKYLLSGMKNKNITDSRHQWCTFYCKEDNCIKIMRWPSFLVVELILSQPLTNTSIVNCANTKIRLLSPNEQCPRNSFAMALSRMAHFEVTGYQVLAMYNKTKTSRVTHHQNASRMIQDSVWLVFCHPTLATLRWGKRSN